jgi:3-isopropylmalate/(R)-2-methylmalate dehydratase small subunit
MAFAPSLLQPSPTSFFSNAGKNGIVLVRLTEEQVALLLERASTTPNYELTVSLEDQIVTDAEGFHATFEIDPFRRFCLTEGLDDIGLTLRHVAALDTFEKQHDNANWLKPRAASISA